STLAPEKDPTGPYTRYFHNPVALPVAIPGQAFWVKVHATNPTDIPVRLESIVLVAPQNESWAVEPAKQTGGDLKGNQSTDVRFTAHAARKAGFTRPYFTRPDIEQAYYDIQDSKYLNLSAVPYPLSAKLHFLFNGLPFELSQVVQSINRVTGAGAVPEPLIVGPAISVSIAPPAGIVSLSAKSFD